MIACGYCRLEATIILLNVFAFSELLARVQALIRRATHTSEADDANFCIFR